MPTETVDERRAALLGFVYSPFRAEDFLAPVVSGESSNVSFKLYDGSEEKPESLLFASKPEPAATDKFNFSPKQASQ